MTHLTVTKTKDYLVVKIPLRVIKERRENKIFITTQRKKAILEGLKAFEKGRVSKSFKNAKEAITL